MGKGKFSNAGSSKIFTEVARDNAVKGNIARIVILHTNNLLDYPNNIEIGSTSDLEESIAQVGFTTPIEVTDFGQELGMYVMVSGHRRRAAGVKRGMNEFPCIIRTFKSHDDVDNYVLFANCNRDSAKDPFLYCALYKKHEEYLISIGFEGNKRAEIAKRLDLSIQQADRYNMLTKVIEPVWVLIKDDLVGMSSVLPLASHPVEEQEKILIIMQACLGAGDNLTRDMVKKIVDGFRGGKSTYVEIRSILRDNGVPFSDRVNMNTESDENNSDVLRGSNGSMHSELGQIGQTILNPDEVYVARIEQESNKGSDGTYYDSLEESQNEKTPSTVGVKEEQTARDVIKFMRKLDACFSKGCKFPSAEDAKQAIKNMGALMQSLTNEMYSLGREFELQDIFKTVIDGASKRMNDYVKK